MAAVLVAVWLCMNGYKASVYNGLWAVGVLVVVVCVLW